jgi:glycosidase
LLLAGIGIAQQTYQTVGVIGDATARGWDASTPMALANTGDAHQWVVTLKLKQGNVKFRANDTWDVNWGSKTFPSGSGVQNGAEIPIPSTGYYTVHFNDVTGSYFFQTLTPSLYSTVGLIGNATPLGWDASTPMIKGTDDPHEWTLDITLVNGEAKFRANNSWDVNWGANAFPSGKGGQGGPNIPVAAGKYTITFNDVTGEYNFGAPVYQTVGIIGTATDKDWSASTPMALARSTDPHNWVLTALLKVGLVKFRANDSWDVNWGANAFPAGTGTQGGVDIPVPEGGWYTIRFNDITGAYTFTLINYATVGIIGSATAGGWNNSTPMTKEADGHTWTLKNTTLTNGEAKFRANNAWTVNWGAPTFPTGVGTQDGLNIPVTGGVYDITFHDVTGAYQFLPSVGDPDAIVVLDPAKPGLDVPVKITYNANRGISGLQSASKVYMHSGVVLSGPDGTGWNNVVGNWGQDDGLGEMTPVAGAPGKWQITLPSMRQYYNVEQGVPVFRLGMVFRNADGTKTGKSETDGDIFVSVDPGDFVRFTVPMQPQLFAISGNTVQIAGEASSVASNITLEIDEGAGYQVVKQVANSKTIDYNYTVGTASNLQLRLTAQIGGKTVTSVRSLTIQVRNPVTIVALPAGLRNGINYDPTDPTKATLVLQAPQKEFVYAVGDFNNWQISEAYQMNRTPDGETFWLELTNLEAQKEYVFQYWVEGTIKVGDPYADKVADPYNDSNIPASVYPGAVAYNRTADGIATALQTGQQPYQWQHPAVKGGRPAKENLVVYELLVRDFQKTHSYKDVIAKLPYLKSLGVNAIELMPIMEFEGNESWGYNSSYLFAPDKYYGTKNDLKAFIDKAHEEGFSVLLDMVLNHQFGQSPMVRMYWDAANNRPAANSPWFNPEATHPFNVGYDFNHESPYTKRYVDDVNKYWLEEYKFDGFRFDLSKGFTQTNNPNDVGAWSQYDQSRINILKRMTDKIRETDANAYVIMEHLADNSEEKVLADYGIMLWGNLNHSYSDVVEGNTGTDLNWSLSSTRGWNEKNLIAYMESHDEERLMVRAKNEGQSGLNYDIKQTNTALERIKLASAFYYTVPGPKMIWQFGELGYDIPIDFNGRTGNKPVPWGQGSTLNYDQDPERVRLLKAKAAIINLVNKHNNVFEGGNFSWTPSGQFRRINTSSAGMNVTIVGNFGVNAGSMQPYFQHTGTWYDFFSGKAFNITSTTGNIALAPGEFRIYTDQKVDFPEPGLVNSTINCVTTQAVAGTITCYGGTTTVTVTGTGGTAPYVGVGTFTVGAGTYSYTVTDANGCMSTASVTVEDADEATNATWYLDEDGDGYYTSTTKACISPGAGYTRTVIAEGDCAPEDETKWRTTTLYVDVDGDGYDAGKQEVCYGTEIPAGSKETTLGSDCDDANANTFAGITWYLDSDGDGFGNAESSIQACAAPAGYVANSSDCNDGNPAVNPGATEVCNGLDDDCDGAIDDFDANVGSGRTTFYHDNDGDGYGHPENTILACSAPAGYTGVGGDCNDNDAGINPGAVEVCNGIDDDCDGLVDDLDNGTVSGRTTFYLDSDRDGYGSNESTILACSAPVGYISIGGDCNDGNATVHPGAAEVCNGIDDDCDGAIDDFDSNVSDGRITFYRDKDGDGFGDARVSLLACSAPAGYISNNTDCNDGDHTVYPGAPELCDGKDNNCDGRVDEGVLITYYRDSDGDGWGDNNATIQNCTPKNGYVAKGGDCNDRNAKVNPGVAEICGNGIDDNCNGAVDEGCALPNITISDVMVFETQGTARLTVSLSATSTSAVKVNFQTVDGTAGSKDFRAARGTLTIPAGSREGFISITILTDRTDEPDEYFDVQLSGAVGATLSKSAGRVIIRNGAPVTTTNANDKREMMKEVTREKTVEPLAVTALPNPSRHYFTLVIKSRLNKPVTITVTDAIGRILEVRRNIAADGSLTLGDNFRPGVYFVDVRQGELRKQVRLIKGTPLL